MPADDSLRAGDFTERIILARVFAGLHSVGRIFSAEYFDYGSESTRFAWLSTNASGACRFEAKGTTGTSGNLSGALAEGKIQTARHNRNGISRVGP